MILLSLLLLLLCVLFVVDIVGVGVVAGGVGVCVGIDVCAVDVDGVFVGGCVCSVYGGVSVAGVGDVGVVVAVVVVGCANIGCVHGAVGCVVVGVGVVARGCCIGYVVATDVAVNDGIVIV